MLTVGATTIPLALPHAKRTPAEEALKASITYSGLLLVSSLIFDPTAGASGTGGWALLLLVAGREKDVKGHGKKEIEDQNSKRRIHDRFGCRSANSNRAFSTC